MHIIKFLVILYLETMKMRFAVSFRAILQRHELTHDIINNVSCEFVLRFQCTRAQKELEQKNHDSAHFILELAERMKDEKLKAEDIKDRALSLLQDKEREFTANQRRWESELALGQQQLTQYKEQLEIMSGSSTPSVLQIRYFWHTRLRKCELWFGGRNIK